MNRRLYPLVLSGALIVTPLALMAAPASATLGPICTAGTCTVSYGLTSAPDTFTVPAGVTSITASVAGGSGGGGHAPSTNLGGAGGSVVARVPVTPGQTLTVVVGGKGADSIIALTGTAAGGYGGGGDGTSRNGTDGAGGGGSFLSQRRQRAGCLRWWRRRRLLGRGESAGPAVPARRDPTGPQPAGVMVAPPPLPGQAEQALTPQDPREPDPPADPAVRHRGKRTHRLPQRRRRRRLLRWWRGRLYLRSRKHCPQSGWRRRRVRLPGPRSERPLPVDQRRRRTHHHQLPVTGRHPPVPSRRSQNRSRHPRQAWKPRHRQRHLDPSGALMRHGPHGLPGHRGEVQPRPPCPHPHLYGSIWRTPTADDLHHRARPLAIRRIGSQQLRHRSPLGVLP